MEVNKSSLRFEVHPFGPNVPLSYVREVVIDGLDSSHLMCLSCTKVFPVSTSSGKANSPLKIKEIMTKIAFVDMMFLFPQEDALGFCQPCTIKINQLYEIYANFLRARNELIGISTELSHSVVRTNHKLLQMENNDSFGAKESYFKEWNLDRIRNMLLCNLPMQNVGVESNKIWTDDTVSETMSSIDEVMFRAPVVPVTLRRDDEDFEDAHGLEFTKMCSHKQDLTRLKSSVEVHDHECQVINSNVKCQHCEEIFVSEELLKIHLTVHNVEADCDGSNGTTSKLNSNRSKFICTLCNKMFTRSYSLRLHLRTHGQGKESLSCDKCSKKFTSARTLKAHEKIHIEKEKRLLKCPMCNKTVSQKRSLDTHLLRHHAQDFKPSVPTCDVCQKTFRSILLLINHMNIHQGDFQCDVSTCRKAFKSCSHLEKHEKIHQSTEQVFDCDFCLDYFKDQASLDDHVASHNFTQSFLCDYCGKSFSSKQFLLTHLRLHKHLEFRCEICDKNFYSASNLKYHQRIHTGERPFQCPECSQTFVQKASLKLHMRKHSGVSPFTCPYCVNSGFSYKLAFRQHLATKHPEVYLESKKFLCKTCWKTFGQESELLEHEVLHDKHKCKLCNRQFKMLVHLKEHLLRHASLKPHKCIFCEDKAFLRRKNLVDHIKKCHPHEDVEAATEADNNITYIVHISS